MYEYILTCNITTHEYILTRITAYETIINCHITVHIPHLNRITMCEYIEHKHRVPSKNNRPPLSSPMLTYICLLSNRGSLKFRMNLKILKIQKMVVHEIVLFETQPSATMLNIHLNVTCGKSCAICSSL